MVLCINLADECATVLGSYIQFYTPANSFPTFIVAVIFLRFSSFSGYSKVLFQVAAMILFFLCLLLNARLSEVVIPHVSALSFALTTTSSF